MEDPLLLSLILSAEVQTLATFLCFLGIIATKNSFYVHMDTCCRDIALKKKKEQEPTVNFNNKCLQQQVFTCSSPPGRNGLGKHDVSVKMSMIISLYWCVHVHTNIQICNC